VWLLKREASGTAEVSIATMKYMAGVYIGLELSSCANLMISADSIGFLLQFRALTGTLITQSEI